MMGRQKTWHLRNAPLEEQAGADMPLWYVASLDGATGGWQETANGRGGSAIDCTSLHPSSSSSSPSSLSACVDTHCSII